MLPRLTTAPLAPDTFSPLVWRADQLAGSPAVALSSGCPALDRELPGGGWPTGGLTELLLAQHGIGEIRMLLPALQQVAAQRPVALIQPPHLPQAAAWIAEAFPLQRLLWLHGTRSADACWAAEQALRNGSCGAVLMWQSQLRTEVLRRLHLAAQASDTLFWLIRPLAFVQQASPAPLRLELAPARGGVRLSFLKRRGPPRDEPLFVPFPGVSEPVDSPGSSVLSASPVTPVSSVLPASSHSSISSVSAPLLHAHLDRHLPAAAAARSPASALG